MVDQYYVSTGSWLLRTPSDVCIFQMGWAALTCARLYSRLHQRACCSLNGWHEELIFFLMFMVFFVSSSMTIVCFDRLLWVLVFCSNSVSARWTHVWSHSSTGQPPRAPILKVLTGSPNGCTAPSLAYWLIRSSYCAYMCICIASMSLIKPRSLLHLLRGL